MFQKESLKYAIIDIAILVCLRHVWNANLIVLYKTLNLLIRLFDNILQSKRYSNYSMQASNEPSSLLYIQLVDSMWCKIKLIILDISDHECFMLAFPFSWIVFCILLFISEGRIVRKFAIVMKISRRYRYPKI